MYVCYDKVSSEYDKGEGGNYQMANIYSMQALPLTERAEMKRLL